MSLAPVPSFAVLTTYVVHPTPQSTAVPCPSFRVARQALTATHVSRNLQATRGLAIGESRRTRIEVSRAYGDRSEELLFTVERNAFPSGIPVEVGSRVPLSNGMTAGIVDVTDTSIKMDANHELAGKPLTFDMQLVAFAETVLSPAKDGLERAIFGLGCFWGESITFPTLIRAYFCLCSIRFFFFDTDFFFVIVSIRG